MSYKALTKARINKRLCRHFRSHHELIKPVAEAGMFNHRCHDNCAEYQRLHPEVEVVETVYIRHNYPILHYVVHDPERGEYLEVTLGYLAPSLEYYRLRAIHVSDVPDIRGEFDRAIDTWTEEWTAWWQRPFIRRLL